MTEVKHARRLLLRALRQYSAAESEAEIGQAVLALHTGLEEAFRAHLASQGHNEVSHRDVSFPKLVDLIRDHTVLFQGDRRLPSLLVALNTTRAKIAHPRGEELSLRQITGDAEQLSNLVRRFWSGLFGEICPVSLARGPESRSKPHLAPKAQAGSGSGSVGARRTPPKLAEFLRIMWRDESGLPFQKMLFLKRVIGIAILFALAKWCKSGAISTARWPEPVKYGGVALFLVTVVFFVWGIIITWKVLDQFRLRGLLIVFGIGYLLIVGTLVLTSDRSLPLHQEALSTTRRLVIAASHQARDAFQAVLRAPEEFRFAYTGRRRPLQLAGTDPEDTTYLTPIPANRLAEISLTTQPSLPPTGDPAASQERTPTPPVPGPTTAALELLSPGCPHPQARLITPKMNQVIGSQIQVEGSANIDEFDYYKFEIRREDIEDEWHWVESFYTPVENGALGVWEVSHLPEGVYTFRLTVVNKVGNYPFPPCEVTVYVTH